MELLKQQAVQKLNHLASVIESHEQNESRYAELLGSSIIPDLANEIIFDELEGAIPKELERDLDEFPSQLNEEIEEALTEKSLEKTIETLDILIEFWEKIIFFETKRLDSLKSH